MKLLIIAFVAFISVEVFAQEDGTTNNKTIVDTSKLTYEQAMSLANNIKAAENAKKTQEIKDAQAVLADAQKNNDNNPTGQGIKDWGLGFGLGVEQFRDKYIDKASLQGDNKIVTTEKTSQTLPSAWLTLNWNCLGLASHTKQDVFGNDVSNVKFGLFAGVKLIGSNGNSSFSAFSFGPQVSFVTNEKIISIGAGWVTHGTRKYASGIVDGEPLPAQYKEIIYKEGTENSYMLMMSVGL